MQQPQQQQQPRMTRSFSSSSSCRSLVVLLLLLLLLLHVHKVASFAYVQDGWGRPKGPAQERVRPFETTRGPVSPTRHRPRTRKQETNVPTTHHHLADPTGPQKHHNNHNNHNNEMTRPCLTLDAFEQRLSETIQDILQDKGNLKPQPGKPDRIAELLGRVRLSQEDWSRFVLFDKEGTYTRNLVLTDNQHYTLLALCWNPGCESPIHDHPCDGCWMKVCEGSIQESRYERRSNNNNNNGKDLLVCTTAETYQEGDLAYIHDSMGYHKVGNPCNDQPAVTLHLYCPPFESCRTWLDHHHEEEAEEECALFHESKISTVRFFSENGIACG